MRFFPSQPDARRTLLVAAAILLLSPIPGSILIDLCPISARHPEAAATITRWHAHPAAPEILILGTSRTGFCFDVAAATSSFHEFADTGDGRIFDASLPGNDPIMMKSLAGQLLDRGGAPQLILIEVSVELSGRRNYLFDLTLTRLFTARDIAGHLGDIFHSNSKALSRLLSSRLLPFHLHRAQFRAWAGQAWSSVAGIRAPTPPSAFEGFDWDAFVRQDLAVGKPAQRIPHALRVLRRQLADYEIAGKTPAALEHVVALCRQRGATVILFEPPLPSAHRALYSSAVTERYHAFINGLAKACDCRFVDLSARLPDTMFADNDHVNFDGRGAASRMIAQEILAPAWRERAARQK